MSFVIVSATALLAAALSFFSGFGLGTLLLPAFALFFPVEEAIALTAIVHFLNGLFKLLLVGRDADRKVVIRFGLPAIVAALAGAALLVWLGDFPPLAEYQLLNRDFKVLPVKVVVGGLLLLFTLVEFFSGFSRMEISSRWLALGGALSGFFGGLSGHQGALRSAFLVKAGLSKEAFIATGVVIACMIDVSRLGVYARNLATTADRLDWALLTASVTAAFAGTLLGNRFLKKITIRGVQRIVGVSLMLFALGLISGLL